MDSQTFAAVHPDEVQAFSEELGETHGVIVGADNLARRHATIVDIMAGWTP
jgi:hypothetical protein